VVLPHDEAGGGSAVLLLHAGVADRTMWAEHLGPLAEAGHRAVAVDLPGFGEAPLEEEFRPWSDVIETLDALEIDRAAVVGNSFGGSVAMEVAMSVPDRVTALVLVSARPPWQQPSTELESAWEAEESALERGDIEGAVAAVLDAWTRPDSPQALRERVAAMQRRAFEIQLAGPEPAEVTSPAEADPDGVGELQMPVLVVTGESDMVDFRPAPGGFAERLGNATVVVLPGVGHLAPLESPAQFDRLLIEFLGRS